MHAVKVPQPQGGKKNAIFKRVFDVVHHLCFYPHSIIQCESEILPAPACLGDAFRLMVINFYHTRPPTDVEALL